MLNWQPLVTSRDPSFTRKGTEIARATPDGFMSRFAIYEVRCLSADGYPDVFYRVRDAETVSDADIKAGIRPKIVFEAHTLDAVLKYLTAGKETPHADT